MAKIMLQLHGSRGSGAGLHKSNKRTNVWVFLRVLQTFDEEHGIRKFQQMHERQKVERIQPGFVIQEIITGDNFCGSKLDLFQACDVFQQPGSPELGTVTKLGAD